MPSQLSIGKHRLRATGAALVEKEGKDPSVEVYVQDTEDPDEIGTIYLSTSDAAFEWTEKKLKLLGWDPKENDYRFDYLNQEGEDNPLRGVEFDVDVTEGKPYTGQDGKERQGFPQINFVGLSGFSERMPPEKAKSFAAQLRAKLISQRGQPTAAGKKPAPARRPAAAASPSKEVQDSNSDVWPEENTGT